MSIARYLLTQLIAYSIDLGVYTSLLLLSILGPIPANVVAKISAGCLAFFIHRHYTFKAQESRSRPQMVRYAVLFTANIPLSALALWLILQVITNPVIAKVISDVAIVLINYWLSRQWVFSARKET